MHTMMDYPLTLAAILDRVGRYFAGVEIVSRLPDRSLHRSNWGEVHDRALRLAERLQSAGLKKGDRVATLMWNHYVHLECYFGVPVAGGVLHPLNLRLHPDEIGYIANHAQDRFLIVDDMLLPVLEKFAAKVKFEHIFVVRHPGASSQHQYEDYEGWLTRASGNFKPAGINEQDGATMCYTSGTPGNPKAVLYSHRALVLHSMAQTMADSCAASQPDAMLLASSMFHANGWAHAFTSALLDAKFLLPGPHLDAHRLLEFLEHDISTLPPPLPTC